MMGNNQNGDNCFFCDDPECKGDCQELTPHTGDRFLGDEDEADVILKSMMEEQAPDGPPQQTADPS